MIKLKNFTIGFGERILLDNINTFFPEYQLTSLIGRNGTGKSSLMKALCGINDKYCGEVLIEEKKLRDIPRNKLAKLVSYVNTQRPRMANLKCWEVVALGRTPYTNWHGKLTDNDNSRVVEALGMVGMNNYSDRNFNSLSDGESQKVMIARAIAQDTPIILLDEPTSFLDLPTRFELVSLLGKLAHEQKKTVVFSTHELDLALKMSDRVALVENQKLYNLPSNEMAQNPILESLLTHSYLK